MRFKYDRLMIIYCFTNYYAKKWITTSTILNRNHYHQYLPYHCRGLYDTHIGILVVDLTKEDIADEDFAVEASVQ